MLLCKTALDTALATIFFAKKLPLRIFAKILVTTRSTGVRHGTKVGVAKVWARQKTTFKEIDGKRPGPSRTRQAKTDIQATAGDYAAAVRNVGEAIGPPDAATNLQPWPSHIYFEDISVQSQFEMIEIIVAMARDNGKIPPKNPRSQAVE